MKVTSLLLCFISLSFLWGQENSNDSALFYYQNFEFQKAISILESSGAKMESNEIYLLGKAYQKTGQLEKAKKAYFIASQKDSNNIALRNELAKSYYQNKQYDSALLCFNHLLSIQKNNGYYWKQIGKIHTATNNYFEAISAYKSAINLNSNDLESSIELVKLLMKIELYDTAYESIITAIESYPANRTLLKLQLKLDYSMGKNKELIAVAEKLFQLEDSSILTQKLLGITHYHEKNYEDAIHFLENVLEVDTKSETLHYYLGLSYRENGNQKLAADYLEKAIDLGVSDNLGTYYTQLAVSYEEGQNFKKSIHAYKIAYKSTKNKILLYHLARNYDLFYKDKSIAIKYYEKYLASNDSANDNYFDYTKYRIQELKMQKHFNLDTLN